MPTPQPTMSVPKSIGMNGSAEKKMTMNGNGNGNGMAKDGMMMEEEEVAREDYHLLQKRGARIRYGVDHGA